MNARQTRKPLVSVVISTLNRPTLLLRAIVRRIGVPLSTKICL